MSDLLFSNHEKKTCESIWIIRIYLDNGIKSQSPFTNGSNRTSGLMHNDYELTSPSSQSLLFKKPSHFKPTSEKEALLLFEAVPCHICRTLGICWQAPFVALRQPAADMKEGPRVQAEIWSPPDCKIPEAEWSRDPDPTLPPQSTWSWQKPTHHGPKLLQWTHYHSRPKTTRWPVSPLKLVAAGSLRISRVSSTLITPLSGPPEPNPISRVCPPPYTHPTLANSLHSNSLLAVTKTWRTFEAQFPCGAPKC